MTRNSESVDSASEEGRGSDSSATDPEGSTDETPPTRPDPFPPGVLVFADAEAVCIPVEPEEKGPRRSRDPENLHSPGDRLLRAHIDAGHGYALTMRGDRAALDADEPEALRPALDALPETAWQRSGSRTSEHWLYRVPGLDVDVPLTHPGTGADVGHVKATPQSIIIGPGSRHPSGNYYGPLHGDTVATVDRETFADALEPFTDDRGDARLRGEEPDPPRADRHSGERGSTGGSGATGATTGADALGVYDVLSRAAYPEEQRVTHPHHDSDTGANFKVDAGGETWHCWRHDVTGNAAHLLALETDHADCGDWVPGGLPSEVWAEVFADAREAGYAVGDPPDEGGSGNGNASGGERTEEPPAEPDDDASLADVWAYVRTLYADTDDPESTRLADNRAVRALRRDDRTAFVTDAESDVLYRYDPDDGIYRPDGEAVARSLLTNDPDDSAARGPTALADTSATAGDDRRRLGTIASPRRCDRITDLLKSRTRVDVLSGDATPEGYLVAENGLLNLNPMLERARNGEQADYTDVRREPFTHEQVHRTRLHTAYDPTADPDASEFTEKLAENVAGTGLDRLQEFAGYCLLTWNQPYKKALLCIGPTHSGKSKTYLSVVEALVGAENNAAVALSDLAGGGRDAMYAADDLHDSFVTIRNEVDARKLASLKLFKEVVGGTDPIRARPPYGHPYSYTPTAKLLYAANRVPDVENETDAFYDRWLHVQFPDPVAEADRDHDLFRRLTENELPAVLNWALTGLARLVGNDGRFTGELGIPEKRALWQSYGGAFDRFIQRLDVTDDHSHTVRKTKLHQTYVAFAAHLGDDDPMHQQQFTRELGTVSGVDAKGDRYTGVRIPDELRQDLADANTGPAVRGALADRDGGDDDADGEGESDAERDASDPRPTGLGDYN